MPTNIVRMPMPANIRAPVHLQAKKAQAGGTAAAARDGEGAKATEDAVVAQADEVAAEATAAKSQADVLVQAAEDAAVDLDAEGVEHEGVKMSDDVSTQETAASAEEAQAGGTASAEREGEGAEVLALVPMPAPLLVFMPLVPVLMPTPVPADTCAPEHLQATDDAIVAQADAVAAEATMAKSQADVLVSHLRARSRHTAHQLTHMPARYHLCAPLRACALAGSCAMPSNTGGMPVPVNMCAPAHLQEEETVAAELLQNEKLVSCLLARSSHTTHQLTHIPARGNLCAPRRACALTGACTMPTNTVGMPAPMDICAPVHLQAAEAAEATQVQAEKVAEEAVATAAEDAKTDVERENGRDEVLALAPLLAIMPVSAPVLVPMLLVPVLMPTPMRVQAEQEREGGVAQDDDAI